MAMTATRLETGVFGNKRYELWSFTGSSDTGGTITSAVTPDALFYVGSTGTSPTSLVLTFVQSTKVVTVAYASGSPTGRLMVVGH